MDGFFCGFALALVVAASLPNTAVTASEFQRAAARCELNHGVDKVRGESIYRSLNVTCRNGANFVLSDNEGV